MPDREPTLRELAEQLVRGLSRLDVGLADTIEVRDAVLVELWDYMQTLGDTGDWRSFE